MRDSFQQLKWILVFIVAIFILFIFMDWGVGGANPGSDSDSFAARVNGETIPIDEFERALYFTEKRYEMMYGQPITQEMRDAMGLSRQVLNSLIEEKLMLQQARRLNLDATEAEIRREILEMPALSPEGKFVGPDAYEGWVRRNTGYQSVAAFEQEVGRGVTLEKMNSALRNSVIITPAAAEAEYRRRNESAKIRYVLLSADSLLPSITVTPGEVQAYYRAHSTDYSHPEQRNVKYLLADLTRIRGQVTLTEAELRARYDATREEFKAPESVRAQHILLRLEATATPEQQAEVERKARDLVAQLRAGGDFAALAKQHSQDPGSATNGGDLGLFERGRMVAEFEAAAFSAPIGTITDPVKTTYGYHVIKVNEKRPGGYRPFFDVRSQIEQQLREQKAAEMARERIAQAKVRVDQAKPKTDADLRAFADNHISFNETGWFGRNEAILGMGRLPALNDWAFRSRVGEVGTQLETPRGPIIPYLSGTREAGVAALEEVKQRVENEVKREKAREVARKQLQSTFSTTKTVDATARQLSLTPVTSDITRAGFVTGLSGKVESVVNEALSGEAGAVKGPLVVDQGAVVFEITERKKFDPNEFSANKQSLIVQMQQTEAPKLRASLLGKLREEADVIVNTRVIQSASQPQPAA